WRPRKWRVQEVAGPRRREPQTSRDSKYAPSQKQPLGVSDVDSPQHVGRKPQRPNAARVVAVVLYLHHMLARQIRMVAREQLLVAPSKFGLVEGCAGRSILNYVRAVQDSIGVPHEEFAHLVGGLDEEIAEALGGVDEEVRIPVEPRGDLRHVVLRAAQMRADDSQRRILRDPPIPRLDQALPGRKVRPPEQMVPGMIAIELEMRAPFVQRLPRSPGLGNVGDHGNVLIRQELPDRGEGIIIHLKIPSCGIPHAESEILPDLDHSGPLIEMSCELRDHGVGARTVDNLLRIERRAEYDAVWMSLLQRQHGVPARVDRLLEEALPGDVHDHDPEVKLVQHRTEKVSAVEQMRMRVDSGWIDRHHLGCSWNSELANVSRGQIFIIPKPEADAATNSRRASPTRP